MRSVSLGQIHYFGTDRRRLAMAGVHDSVIRQGEQPVGNALHDYLVAAETPTGGAGATVEQRVAAEHNTVAGQMKTTTTGRMAGGVQHVHLVIADFKLETVPQRVIEATVGILDLPQHLVVRMQENWSAGFVRESAGCIDVIVVAVRADDRFDLSPCDPLEDRLVVMGGIDDDDLVVVADEPDVVVHVEVFAVQAEDPGGDDAVDSCGHYITTTLRSTPPCSIL